MHYSDDELAAFRKGRANTAQQTIIEAHLAECADCRETLALFETIDEGFARAEVWSGVPAFQERPPRLDEILAEEARIERENADALRRLARYLKSPIHFENARVHENERFRDAGVVRMLTAEAAALRERKPKFALQLATAAVVVARKLESEPTESRQLLLAAALRERANALRFAGKLKKALASLDEAEDLFRALPDPRFDLAIIEYIRATVLFQLDDKSAEALDLARSAIKTFQAYGDRQRELSARLVEAALLVNLSGGVDAAHAYESIISLAQALNRKDILGYAYHNAASSYVDLNNLELAEHYYAEALARLDEDGNSAGKAHTEWELARMLVLRGQLQQGARALDTARRGLLELGLHADHALATLDWAAARLASNRPEGVAAACREIVMHYESEGATRNARLALACVHEALRQGKATPWLLRQVREYLTQLQRNPSASFELPR